MKKFSKKTIVMAIIITLIASNLVGLVLANEKRDSENTEEQQSSMIIDDSAMVPPSESSISVTGSVYGEQEENIERIKNKSKENRKNRLWKEDQFNYTKKDIEELLLGGATVEDIYASDEIGNEWLVEPKELVKMIKEGNKSWDVIESQVKDEKEKKLEELIKKYPNSNKKLAKKTMNTAEKLELLQLVDTEGEDILAQAVNSYESDGLKGLRNAKNYPKKIDEQSVLTNVYGELEDILIEDAIDSTVQPDSTTQEGK